jgi:hypothetical protein
VGERGGQGEVESPTGAPVGHWDDCTRRSTQDRWHRAALVTVVRPAYRRLK